MPDVVKTLQVEIDAKVNDGQAKKQLDDLAKDRKATIKTDLQGAKEAGKQMDNLTKDKEVELKINENFMKQFEKLGRDVTDILSNMQKITEEGGNMGFGEDGIRTLGRFKDKLDGIEDTLKSIGEKMKIEKLEPSSAYDIRIDALKSRIDFVKKNEGKLKRLQKELTGETSRGKTIKTDDEDDPRLFGKKLAANINKGYGIDGLAEEQYKQYIISLKRYMDLGGDIDVPLSFSFDTDKGTVKGTTNIRDIIDELNGLGEMHVDLDKYIPTKSVKTLEQNLANLEAKRERAIAKESGRALTVGLDDITIDNLVNKFKEAKSAADEFFESLKTNGKFDFGEEGLGQSIKNLFTNIQEMSNLMKQFDIPMKKNGPEATFEDAAEAAGKAAEKTKEAKAAIDDLQNDGSKTAKGSPLGDSLKGGDIQGLIDTLDNLYNEIEKISTAIGSVSEENGISSLLSQMKNVGDVLKGAFDVSQIDAYKESFQSLLDIVQDVSDVLGHYGEGTNQKARNNKKSIMQLNKETLDATKSKDFNFNFKEDQSVDSLSLEQAINAEWRDQYERYLSAYNTFMDNFIHQQNDTLASDIQFLTNRLFSENTSGSGLFDAFPGMQKDFIGKYNENAIKSIQKPEDAVKRIQQFFSDIQKYAKTALESDVSQDKGLWESISNYKFLPTDFKYLNKRIRDVSGVNRNGTKKSAAETIKEMLTGANVNVNGDQQPPAGAGAIPDLSEYIQQINELASSLTKFQGILKQGLGISGKKGNMSYLEQLNTEMKKITGDEAEPKEIHFNPIVDNIRGKIESVLAEPFEVDIKVRDNKGSKATGKLNLPDYANKITDQLVEDFGLTKYTSKELNKSILDALNMYSAGGTPENDITSTLMNILIDDNNLQDLAREGGVGQKIRSWLSGKKIKILPEFRQESGDAWNDDRRLLGLNIMQNEGQDIMEVLEELNNAIGTTFNLNDSQVGGWNQLLSTIKQDLDPRMIKARLKNQLSGGGEGNPYFSYIDGIAKEITQTGKNAYKNLDVSQVASPIDINVNPITDNVRGEIEGALAAPFDLHFNPITDNIRGEIEGELSTQFDFGVNTKREEDKKDASGIAAEGKSPKEETSTALDTDKAKQDAEELEGAYNETGAAIKSYLDSIESTKLDPSQWEEALRIAGNYREELGEIADVTKTVLHGADGDTTSYTIKGVNGKTANIYPSGEILVKNAQFGTGLKDSKESLKEIQDFAKEYEQTATRVNNLMAEKITTEAKGGVFGKSGELEEAKNRLNELSAQADDFKMKLIDVWDAAGDEQASKLFDRLENGGIGDIKSLDKLREAEIFADESKVGNAIKKLHEYTSAVEEVAKAQEELDFSQSADKSVLVERLENAKARASELKSELKDVVSVLEQLPDSEKDKYKKELKSALDLEKDPTATASYQVKANNRDFTNAQKALKNYEDAVEDLAEVWGKFENTGNNQKPEMVAELEEALINVNKTKQELTGLQDVFKNKALFSDTESKDIFSKIAKLEDLEAHPEKSNRYVQAAYNELMKPIKERENLQDQRNKFIADEMLGKPVAETSLNNLKQQINDISSAADEAIQKIRDLYQTGKITDLQAKIAEDSYKQAQTGDTAPIEKAQQKLDQDDLKEAESNLKKYEQAVSEVARIQGQIAANKLQGKEDIALVQQLQEAIDKANEAKTALLGVADVFNKSFVSKDDQDKYQKRITDADEALKHPENTSEYAANEYSNIAKSINDCWEAAQKLYEVQEKFLLGETTQRQVDAASDRLNKTYEIANNGMKRLEEMNKQNSKNVSDNTLTQAKDMMQDVENIKNSFQNVSVDFGFETIEKGFQTLIKNANTYAKIVQKRNDGKPLNYSELQFLDRYEQKYDDAIKKAGLFTDAQNKAAEASAKFDQELETAQANAFAASLGEIEKELLKLNTLYVNQDGLDAIDRLRDKYNDITEAVKKYGRESQEVLYRKNIYKNAVKEFGEKYSSGYYTQASDEAIATTRRRMAEYAFKNPRDTETIDWIDSIKDSLKGISGAGLDEVNAKLEEFKAKALESGNVGKTFGDTLKKSFQGLARYLMTYVGFYEVINTMKQAVGIVRDLDTAFTEMRKVSDEPLSVLREFSTGESFNIANQVGTTAQQIQQSTADFLRLGESFNEAKQSAKEATVLLNVSEFQDINAATESLTAMSQAYKELDKAEIVDKLNYIGNNYSISTSELAESLQKSAGTLKVAGDSIDEAIALTTAGNAVLQDPLTVGQSLKTIALRLNGTTAEEMQEIGEETDGLIATKSKLQKTIKDLTKVESNGYRGFDILDENGNYKSTYEKLEGIAKVYKEIGEEDKKFGTNRQSLLLETIAGKTRAATASSILDNYDMLTKSYMDSALNSAGSAQNELDAYMDSVEGKMTQLQNHLQELAAVTIDSEWLKDLIDYGTSAIEIVTQLADALNGIEGIIGIIGGFLAQKNGFGLFTKDNAGKWKTGLLGDLFINIKDGFSNGVQSGFTTGIKKALSSAFGPSKLGTEAIGFLDQWMSIGLGGENFAKMLNWDGTALNLTKALDLEKAPAAFREVIKDMDTVELSLMSIQDLSSKIQEQTSLASSVKTMGMGLLKGVGSAALTMGISTLVSMAIGGVLTAINNKIHEKENTIKAGKEAESNASQILESGRQREDVIEQAKKRYSALREGVAIVNGEINNINLPEDEFQEFLSLNQQLADSFPNLATNVSGSGDAIVDLGTKAEETSEKLEHMLEISQRGEANQIKEQLPDIVDKAIVEMKDLEKANERISDETADLSIFDDILNGETGKKHVVVPLKDRATRKAINDILQQAGVEQFKLPFHDLWNQVGEYTSNGLLNMIGFNTDKEEFNFDVTENNIDALQSAIVANGRKLSTQIETNLQTIEANRKQIQDNYRQNILPSLQSIFQADPTYALLNGNVGNKLDNIIGNLDASKLLKDFRSQKTYKELDDYILNSFVYPMQNAIDSGEVTEIDLSNLLNFKFDDSTVNEVKEQATSIADAIFGDNEELKEEFLVTIGIKTQIEGEEGTEFVPDQLAEKVFSTIQQNTEKNLRRRADKVPKLDITLDDLLNEFSVDELKTIDEAMQGGQFDFGKKGLENNTESLREWLTAYKEAKPQIEEEPSGKLSDIFADEEFKDRTSQFETNLSSLSSAMESFKENSKLSSEELNDLFTNMPDMAKLGDAIAMEDVGDEMWENIQKYTDVFREFVESADLSDEQRVAANNWLKSYVEQFDEIPSSVDKARESLENFFTAGITPGEGMSEAQAEKQYVRRIEDADEIFSSLQEKYGEDFNAGIIQAIIEADPSMATATVEEWIAEYEGKEVKLKLTADEKELQNIQSKRDNITAKRGAIQARITSSEEQGTFGSATDYKALSDLDQQAVSIAEQEVQNRRQHLTNIVNSLKNNDALYTDDGQRQVREAQNAVLEAMSGASEAQSQAAESTKNYLSRNERQTQFEIDNRSELVSALNEVSEQYANEGKVIDRNTAQQIAAYERQNRADYLSIAAGYKKLAEDPMYADYATEFNALSLQAYNQAQAIVPRTTQQIISESQVASLNADLTELQDKATTIQDAITLQEGQGLKPTLDQYNQLLDNGAKQIDNLEKQNRLLSNQQVGLRRNSARWREIQSQINANNSAISQMNGNLNNWRDSIKNFAGDIGNTLLSALQNAFSESISSTGLQYGTMKELAAQFEGLQGFDFQDVFYNTAQGVKLDAAATERLVDAQYGLMTSDLTGQISAQNAQIAALTRQYNEASSAAEKAKLSMQIDAATTDLHGLYNQLAQYQAFYGQAQKLFSGYGEWQRAQQTENAGETYTQIQGYLKTQKDNYQAGLVGTDEFRAFTAMFDEWGRNTTAAYEANAAKMDRYITEDHQGIFNVLDDLAAAGFGTKTDRGWDIEAGMDVDSAAHAIGVSGEFLQYVLERGEDYGAVSSYVSSAIDGELKLQEAAHDTAEAIRRKNELIAQGAPKEVIQEAYDEITSLDQKTQELIVNTENVARSEGRITQSEVQAAVRNIQQLRARANIAEKEGRQQDAAEYRRMLQNIADEAGIKVDPTGMIDYKQLNKAYAGWNQREDTKATDVTSEQLQGLKLEQASIKNQESLQSGLDKIKNGWKANAEGIQGYLDTLKGADVSKLKEINLNDGNYTQGLEAEERALDSLASAFNMTTEEAQNLVPILEALGQIGRGTEKDYKRLGQGGTLGVDTSAAETYFENHQDLGFSAEDLNFDAASMSIDELHDKIGQLSDMQLKLDVESEGYEEANAQIQELKDAAKQEYKVKVGVENALEKSGLTPEEFLGLSEEEQAEFLVNIKPGTAEWDMAIAEIEGRTMEATINAKLSGDSEMTIDKLSQMKDEELVNYLQIEDSQVDEARAKLEEMAANDYDVKIQLNEASLVGINQAVAAALNGEEYKVSVGTTADTTEAESEIQSLNDEEVTVTADADTSQAESKVRNSIEGKVYTAKVNATVQNSGGFLSRLAAGAKTQTVTTKVDDKASGAIDKIKKSASSGANMKLSVSGAEQLNRISTQIENARKSASQAIRVNIDTSQTSTAVSTLTSRINEIKKTVASPMTINIDTSQTATAVQTIVDRINEAKTAAAEPIMVTVEPSGQDRVDALREAIESLQDKQVTVEEQGATASAARVVLLRSAINSLQSKSIVVSSSVSGLAQVNSLRGSIAALQSKQITITTVYQTIGSPSGGSTKIGGIASRIGGHGWTGTLSSIGSAYAKGTFDEDGRVAKSGSAYNVVNYKDAKAKGDVALKQDTDALTNELGTESLIRNGRWLLLPGGPHIEHLKRGDIVE